MVGNIGCFLLLVAMVRAVSRPYTTVTFDEFNSTEELAIKYFINNGPYASINLFVGVYEPSCETKLKSTDIFFGIQYWVPPDAARIVLVPAAEFPIQLNACIEIFYYVFDTPLTEPIDRTTDLDIVKFSDWLTTTIMTVVRVTNTFPCPVAISPHKDPRLIFADMEHVTILASGRTSLMDLPLGVIMCVHALYDGTLASFQNPQLSPFVDFFTIDYPQSVELSPSRKLRWCNSEVTGLVSDCDDVANVYLEIFDRRMLSSMLGRNFLQPKLVPSTSYSELGFELRTMPDDLFHWLRDIATSRELLPEVYAGPVMNQRSSPSMMKLLTTDETTQLSYYLQQIIQDWYVGNVTLLPTAVYGIRYNTQHTHIDTHTHT